MRPHTAQKGVCLLCVTQESVSDGLELVYMTLEPGTISTALTCNAELLVQREHQATRRRRPSVLATACILGANLRVSWYNLVKSKAVISHTESQPLPEV